MSIYISDYLSLYISIVLSVLFHLPIYSVADPGGGPNRPRPPPPFFWPIFVIFGRGIEEFGFPAPPPPPLFTDPGSASAIAPSLSIYIYIYICIHLSIYLSIALSSCKHYTTRSIYRSTYPFALFLQVSHCVSTIGLLSLWLLLLFRNSVLILPSTRLLLLWKTHTISSH